MAALGPSAGSPEPQTYSVGTLTRGARRLHGVAARYQASAADSAPGWARAWGVGAAPAAPHPVLGQQPAQPPLPVRAQQLLGQPREAEHRDVGRPQRLGA